MSLTAFTLWLALAVVIEYLIDILKQAFPILDSKVTGIDGERVLAIFISLIICFGAQIDFFSMLGVTYNIPFVGYIFSAVLIAGGSGKLHDFIKALTAIGQKNGETEPS